MAERYVADSVSFFKSNESPITDRLMKHNMSHDYNQLAYDAESLAALLEGGRLRRVDHPQTVVPVWEMLDIEVIETPELPMTMYVEAQK